MATIQVPCDDPNGSTYKLAKIKDKVKFVTVGGSCDFVSFDFVPPAPQFTHRDPPSGGGKSITYDYDGTALPVTGAPFTYSTTAKKIKLGNGTGVIKNN